MILRIVSFDSVLLVFVYRFLGFCLAVSFSLRFVPGRLFSRAFLLIEALFLAGMAN